MKGAAVGQGVRTNHQRADGSVRARSPSLQDWLPEERLARFIAGVTGQLDLSKILAVYARKDGRGMAGYHPAMTVRIVSCTVTAGEVRSRSQAPASPAMLPTLVSTTVVSTRILRP
jgi:hypothetical protein